MTEDLKSLLARELHHFDRFLLHLKFLIRDAPEEAQKELFAHLLEEEEEHFEAFKQLCAAAGVDVAAALKPPRTVADIVAQLPAGAPSPWANPQTELAPTAAVVGRAPPPPSPEGAQRGPGGAREHHRPRDLRRFTVGSLTDRR